MWWVGATCRIAIGINTWQKGERGPLLVPDFQYENTWLWLLGGERILWWYHLLWWARTPVRHHTTRIILGRNSTVWGCMCGGFAIRQCNGWRRMAHLVVVAAVVTIVVVLNSSSFFFFYPTTTSLQLCSQFVIVSV